jgi:hypothetical protein
MAQTRAISRACRSAFAFVVTMMDAGLETTPAEEVPSEGFSDNNRPAPRVVDAEVIDPRIVSRELASGETKYAAPERKKKPIAAPEEGADWKQARFIKANRQEKTSKAGKPFVKWGTFIEIEGSEKAVWANTINRDLGETIDAMQDGESVLIQVNETQYGLDLVGIRSSDVPNKTQVENDDAADLDEIPF